MDVAMNVVGA